MLKRKSKVIADPVKKKCDRERNASRAAFHWHM